MRSIDKNKNIKTTTKNIFFCSIMTTVREGQNGWASLPVIKMKFIFVNKTSSFLIVLKFRKTYIQIVKIVWKTRRTSARREKLASSVDNLLGRVKQKRA